jgi:Sigma-70 region 2
MANFRGESICVLQPKRGRRAQSGRANRPLRLSRLLTREYRSVSSICRSHPQQILSLKHEVFQPRSTFSGSLPVWHVPPGSVLASAGSCASFTSRAISRNEPIKRKQLVPITSPGNIKSSCGYLHSVLARVITPAGIAPEWADCHGFAHCESRHFDTVPENIQVNTQVNSAAQYESDVALVRKAQQGDTDAFAALFNAHRPRVYSLCLRMTSNTAEADDLTQDAFLHVFRKLSTFRGDSALSTRLYRLAVNTVL